VLGVGHDITERKLAEEALRESEEKLRGMFESIGDAVTVTDLEGNIIEMNEAAVGLWGYEKKEELIGRKGYDFVAEEHRPLAVQDAEEVLIEGHTKGGVELNFIRKDGSIFSGEARAAFLRDKSGEPAGFISVVRDITERKQAEERRLELERKYLVSSRLTSIGEMAAGIAHEINNPLSPIIGFADLLLKENLPEAVKADLQIIRDCANRAVDVTKGLLVFARQSKPMRKLYSINEVVETTVRLRAYHLKTSNIKVIKELDPELPETMVDAAQMQQVLINIIMNAEYEMNKAHGGGNLTIKTEKKDNIIRILVKDDGQGISSENMEKLFQPFFSTKGVGEGTGLGLSVCHGIVAEHNGRIYAESKEGEGATFIVELPIVRQEEDEEAKLPEPDTGEVEEAALARILVVDDEPSITQVLKRVLTAEGYEVKAVGTAREALRLIRDGKRYALILLDIKMPDMNGIELYQHLDKTIRSLTQRIIFITGDVLGTDTMDFFSRTGASYITKPFDIEQLKKVMKSKLTQRV
jgi:PAS domain S-box-containing protein